MKKTAWRSRTARFFHHLSFRRIHAIAFALSVRLRQAVFFITYHSSFIVFYVWNRRFCR